nr:hypothetical protein BaRGS_004140 [Batillaria attramentaria]
MRDMLKEELREKKKRTKPAIPGKKPKIPGKKPVGTHPKKALTPEEKPDSPGEKSVAPSEAEFTTTGNAMILTEESVDSEKAVTLAVEAVTISEMPRPAELGDSEVNQNKVEDEAHTTTTLSEAEGATEAEAAMSPESETHTQFPGRGGLETTEEDEVHTTTTLAEEEEDASEAEAVMEPESENQTQVPGRDVEETEEEAHTTTTLAEKEEEEDAGEAEAAMSHESETQTQFPDQEIQETEQEEPVYAVVKKNRDSEHKPTEETHTEQTPNEDGDKDTDNGNDLSHAEMQVQMRKKDIDELRQSGVVQQRLKRFSSEEQTPKDDPDETKFSRRQTFPKLTPTANPVARSNTAPRGTTPKFVQNRTGDDDVSNVTVATKDPRITSDPEKWLEDDKELRELLAAIPAEPGMSMKEKKQMIEDVLRRKIGSAPLEELTEAQRERLEASAKSIGQKIKEGMKKFAVNAIDQCRLM